MIQIGAPFKMLMKYKFPSQKALEGNLYFAWLIEQPLKAFAIHRLSHLEVLRCPSGSRRHPSVSVRA